jgi:exopolyphosphatase/guanosine-5'-triphosphate,3'-diphosphate pyrophosphatase
MTTEPVVEPRPDLKTPELPTKLRYEWRTFGHRFGGAEDRIARFGPSKPAESDEIYFLSERGDNVKIRDSLIDVKVLKDVSPEGLEQWAPVMKAPFPLSATDVAKVVDSLRIPVSGALRASYSLDELVESLEKEGSGVRVVRVHKRRVRYTIEGCMAELSDITANGEPIRTIAVESEDAQAVVRAVATLGLRDYVNTSYPRGLRLVLGKVPDRYAVIDVGTNSVKFHIGELDNDGAWRSFADRAEITALGEGVGETKRIGAAALERTIAAISGMVSEAKSSGVHAIAAVGTAVFRIAENAAEVIADIRERTGVQIEVLSGDEEARLAYVATIAALGPSVGDVVVFDTGGGSSQFTFGHGPRVDERFSVDVGAARLTDSFGLDGAVSDDVIAKAKVAVSTQLFRLDGRSSPDAVVGMGGAVTNLTAVSLSMAKYDPDKVQGAVLTAAEIDRQIELYRSMDADERRSIVGLQPNRGAVILAGACIVRTILDKLGKDRLTVSDRGLRHGLVVERFSQG